MVMAARVTATLSKSCYMRSLFFHEARLYGTSLDDFLCKVFARKLVYGPQYYTNRFSLVGYQRIHSSTFFNTADGVVDTPNHTGKCTPVDSSGDAKVKRKKLKGKRAVVKWLKLFRWKKKKEYQRMTTEEKLLFKLRKAQKKEERLVEALKKIEPGESSETTHDPEVLTPEEHFFFLKMGLKCKNYVPVGRRGIYQGVILNMHLHWKKHQTLQVVVKTFSPEEVREIATELARLTGGIVLDIHEEDTIIMYRGKNYSQPPTEIMSPRVTLSRKKALDKSKYRDGLRAVRKYIPRLKQEFELLQAQAERNGTDAVEDIPKTDAVVSGRMQSNNAERLQEIVEGAEECSDDNPSIDSGMSSDSEDLSDIFETDSGTETEEKTERRLYLDVFEKFPTDDQESENFEEHLRSISADSKKAQSLDKDLGLPNFDEVDRMFLRAASLLKKKKR
ncbi:hypothetical protein HS088_TW06G00420 [Tripterygium wilfordii]|uniref:CRM domain-containing protein n=2 Tax=Tripterygium wilfordii TaxID=458696 RepID=A0A7J7DIQ9_TRIWF|nr:uncharacterized CRM domain-containing protein At3g25440, chloroplastic isoform X1 [Tripterygium wilfordii]KAF5746250.1 hypothetical protein HS088_TW06G00420 [Tripterygium wilfordii]